LDKIDYRLILELQKNARISNSKLAGLLGISETAVRRRIVKLVNSGNIMFTAVPNLMMFGYPVVAWFEFHTAMPKIKEIANRLCLYPNIVWASTCIGHADIIAKGIFRSTKDLARFVSRQLGQIADIAEISTMVQLQEIKRTSGKLEDEPLIRRKQINDNHVRPIFDEIDYGLIFELQRNARVSTGHLAKVVQTSIPTVHRRIKKLVNSGSIVLTSIPILMHVPTSTNTVLPLRCIIDLQTDLVHLDTITSKLTSYPQVHTVVIVSGTAQILMSIYVSTIDQLASFVSDELPKIEGVTKATSLILLNILKFSFEWLDIGLLSKPE